jgi:hypothetical protein
MNFIAVVSTLTLPSSIKTGSIQGIVLNADT